ncbi:MAG: helix-turn-helix domain-containing protein [Lachnospiraceae bacterium]|nr:helix-turn-helix domain-containing protein [Lachnospiraceae bacterium]
MISYEPFWKTLLAREVTTYELIFKQGISANTIHRMKHGKAITTSTMDELCQILDCTLSEIAEYRVSAPSEMADGKTENTP